MYVNSHAKDTISGSIMLEKSDRDDVQRVISLSQRMFVMQKSFEQMGIYLRPELKMPFSTEVECDIGEWGITGVPDITGLLETYQNYVRDVIQTGSYILARSEFS